VRSRWGAVLGKYGAQKGVGLRGDLGESFQRGRVKGEGEAAKMRGVKHWFYLWRGKTIKKLMLGRGGGCSKEKSGGGNLNTAE